MADFVLSNVAFQRRIQFVPTQDFAEIADTGSGQRLNRTGGNCIDADILHAEVNGSVADGGIKRGLGNAHDIVVRQGSFAAQIRQGNNTGALVQNRRGATAGFQKRIAGNVHRIEEVRQRRVNRASLQLIFVGKCNRMNDEVNFSPFLAEFLETCFDAG